jgi:hypothetical protein
MVGRLLCGEQFADLSCDASMMYEEWGTCAAKNYRVRMNKIALEKLAAENKTMISSQQSQAHSQNVVHTACVWKPAHFDYGARYSAW